MREISPIPEDIEFEANGSVASNDQSLRILVDELKEVITAERPGERGLTASVRDLVKALGVRSSEPVGGGPKLRLACSLTLRTSVIVIRTTQLELISLSSLTT